MVRICFEKYIKYIINTCVHSIYEEDYSIDLKNSSLITTDIDVEFYEDTTVFQIDKTFIQLEVMDFKAYSIFNYLEIKI